MTTSVRAGTLEREVLAATWMPVSFEVWEEEVWHFGLFDVVFERDAQQRESDEARRIWEDGGATSDEKRAAVRESQRGAAKVATCAVVSGTMLLTRDARGT